MTDWIVPVVVILVPAIVSCLAALWSSRAVAEVFTEAFTLTAHRLDQAAQGKPVAPQTPASTFRAGGRHGFRPDRKQR
ncbi:hypothetical protein M2164_000159 [Streptomyces sp. SAI-208]|uniref:hypothetical protein n=1 Tax=Streptomyces sp. SAI-208 TaxID=2940550 RepID=UPI002472ECE2|nr:hypothetical protein [Streptomyces sp. SAI-208]MDH6604524.1 hypothetical protein [Streptomyces sp. SAI-208]